MKVRKVRIVSKKVDVASYGCLFGMLGWAIIIIMIYFLSVYFRAH